MPEYVHVASTSDVQDPGKLLVEVDAEMIALFHVGGSFYAIDDVCTHDGGPLVDGELQDYTIACPRHGAKFDIRTGAALSMPAIRPTLSHDVKVDSGSVFVRLREAGSGPSGNPAPSAGPKASIASVFPTQTTDKQEALASTDENTDASTNENTATESLTSSTLSEDIVRELLKQVKDPELFVNIIDLGLIYDVSFSPVPENSKQHVSIDMTMTSPACPAGPQLIADTKRAVNTHDSVEDVEVRIVMEPPWTPDRMTDDGRDQLGIF